VTGRLIAWLVFVSGYTVLAYVGRAAGGEPARDALFRYDVAIAGLVQYAITLAVVLWITRGAAQTDMLALRAPRSVSRAIGLSVLVLIGVYVLGATLEPVLHAGREQGLTPSGWESDRAGGFVANFVVVAVVAPIVEELVVRGAGYSLLMPFGATLAVIGTGIAFGLVHGLVYGFVILAAFGVGLALLRNRTNSLYPCIAVHALFNSVALIVSVTT
jgi:membrane protease YdiL (CAAX protease family)